LPKKLGAICNSAMNITVKVNKSCSWMTSSDFEPRYLRFPISHYLMVQLGSLVAGDCRLRRRQAQCVAVLVSRLTNGAIPGFSPRQRPFVQGGNLPFGQHHNQWHTFGDLPSLRMMLLESAKWLWVLSTPCESWFSLVRHRDYGCFEKTPVAAFPLIDRPES